MIVHRILREIVDDVGEETSAERVALELDGTLWDVSALDRVYRTNADEGAPPRCTFFERVIAAGARDLADWEARLASGSRPRGARLEPGTFTWLPPIDARSAVVAFDGFGATDLPVLLSPRAAYEHHAAAPAAGGDLFAVPSVALVLLDDLDFRRPRESALGLTLAILWLDPSRPPGSLERVPAFTLGPGVRQLGQIPGTCHASNRAGDRSAAAELVDLEGRVLAAVLRASAAVALQAGDVVVAPPGALGMPAALPVAAGESVTLRVEPLGELEGRWVAPHR